MLAAIFGVWASVAIAMSVNSGSVCEAPTDEELIELALDHVVKSQPGSVLRPESQGQPYELRLVSFPDKQSFLEANPNCCEVFTKSAIGEYITPKQRVRTNYAGSIRIRATTGVRENSNPKHYPSKTYAYTRIVHIDRCGKVINL